MAKVNLVKDAKVVSRAHLSVAMVSPQRCRLVADLVRGKSLDSASKALLLEKVKSAKIVMKLLKSALSNATQSDSVDPDRLYIHTLLVNEGPRIRRFMPRAQGRADRRLTRTSHITLALAERGSSKVAKKKAVKKTTQKAGE